MHVCMGCNLLAHMECGQFVDEDHTVLKGLIGDQFVKSFLLLCANEFVIDAFPQTSIVCQRSSC